MLNYEADRKAIDAWLEKYDSLEALHDKKWERMEKYDATGDHERARAISKRMDEIDAEMKGMRQALEMFGYTVIYQDGRNVVVYKD